MVHVRNLAWTFPDHAQAYAYRGQGLSELRRYDEAIEDFTVAIRLRPNDAQLRLDRGTAYQALQRFEPAISDLEAALARRADLPALQERLAACCDSRARELANSPTSTRDPQRALQLARRAVELAPGEPSYLKTLGFVEYRAGRYADTITTLGQGLEAGHGQSDASDLYFMAMAHHRLGHREEARYRRDRALSWLERRNNLPSENAKNLAALHAETEAVLSGPVGELPSDVFANPRH